MDVGGGTLVAGGAIGLALTLFGLRILVTGRAPALTSRAFRTLREAGRYHLLFGVALLVLVLGTALADRVSVIASATVAVALVGVALIRDRPRRPKPEPQRPEPARPTVAGPEPAQPTVAGPEPALPTVGDPEPAQPTVEGPERAENGGMPRARKASGGRA